MNNINVTSNFIIVLFVCLGDFFVFVCLFFSFTQKIWEIQTNALY